MGSTLAGGNEDSLQTFSARFGRTPNRILVVHFVAGTLRWGERSSPRVVPILRPEPLLHVVKPCREQRSYNHKEENNFDLHFWPPPTDLIAFYNAGPQPKVMVNVDQKPPLCYRSTGGNSFLPGAKAGPLGKTSPVNTGSNRIDAEELNSTAQD
jgi:hypothetical protein